MRLVYKFRVLPALKEKGYSTAKLRKEKLLGEGTIQSLRSDKPISWVNIEQVCNLLQIQPGDLLEMVKEEAGDNE